MLQDHDYGIYLLFLISIQIVDMADIYIKKKNLAQAVTEWCTELYSIFSSILLWIVYWEYSYIVNHDFTQKFMWCEWCQSFWIVHYALFIKEHHVLQVLSDCHSTTEGKTTSNSLETGTWNVRTLMEVGKLENKKGGRS